MEGALFSSDFVKDLCSLYTILKYDKVFFMITNGSVTYTKLKVKY